MTDQALHLIELIRAGAGAFKVPGEILTRHGPQDYVGSVPTIAGVFFFTDAHLASGRKAIAECFDEYLHVAHPELSWFFIEVPAKGSRKMPFLKTKPLTSFFKEMDENDSISLVYTSGKKPYDAGPWEFRVYGQPEWKVRMGDWGLSGLRLSVPLLSVEEYPAAFRDLFVNCAGRLRAAHGYAGHKLILSATRDIENQPFEALLAPILRGFDAGHLAPAAANAHLGIKTVSWLTATNHEYVARIGGKQTLRSELPLDWFGLFDYGDGLVIQAGPKPEGAPIEEPAPARLVLPNMLLRPIRTPTVRMHYATSEGYLSLMGNAAEQWLQRFDIPEDDILVYKERLLSEPKLHP